MQKARWAMLALTVFVAAAMALTPYNQNYETKIVNGYKVVKGERPAIDLDKVPADAYEHGVLTIKLKEGYKMATEERFIRASSKGYPEVGIKSIDEVNRIVKAQEFDRKYFVMYEMPETHSVEKFKDRHEAWGLHRIYQIEIPADQNVIEAVKQYAALPEIEYAEPVYKKRLIAPEKFDSESNAYYPVDDSNKNSKWTPNDPQLQPDQWHYENTGQTINGRVGVAGVDCRAYEAWDIEVGNPNFIVAVIDQGIKYDHPDLAANMWSGIGYDFGNDDTTIEPDYHGTHVAGTVAAVTNNGIGVAGLAGGDGNPDTGAKLMSCQVFGSTTGGFDTAMIWAADQGASISQNSWGYTSAGTYDQALLDAIDYFNANGGGTGLQGGITIFASGNDNELDTERYPGFYSGAMAVAGHDNQGKRYSNSNTGDYVEICAPAVDVHSTWTSDTYDAITGTSMACPHVSGAAAMIVSNTEGVLTAAELRSILSTSVWDIYAYETDPTYAGKMGTGALDAAAALTLAQEYLGGVPMPGTLTASAISTSQIDLDWTLNEHNDNVLIAWALEGQTIGDPVDGTVYSVGDPISGGGTVLYYGNALTTSHTSLTSQTGYDYVIWSRAMAERQDSQGEWYQEGTYSNSKSASAKTLMDPLTPSATSMGFENSGTIPDGWTQDGNWTFVTTATAPTGPAEGSYFAHLEAGSAVTSKLVTPRFDMTGYSNITLTFKYVTTTYSPPGPTTNYNDLNVYYKTSEGGTWTQLGSTYTGNFTSWQSASLPISDGVLSNDFYIAFEGIFQGGNGVSVDDIVINGGGGSSPPATPTLVSPADGTNTTNKRPAFDWNDVADADSYTIQVDNNSDFSSPEIDQSPTVSSYTPGTDLANGTYYWKVLATNTNGSSAYSGAWTVNIGDVPGVPVLASPADASATSDTTPTFDWGDVTGADSYTIQVDNNSDFSSPEFEESPTVSNYTPTADLANGTYYWRVLATNVYGSGTYSSSWSVAVQAPEPDIALSVASISTTAAPEGTDTDSFDIINNGDADLTYDISQAYTNKSAKADITVHSNNFDSGLGSYTDNGVDIVWTATGGQAVLNANTGGNPNGSTSATLTSDSFDGTLCTDLTLAFDQNFSTAGQSSVTVEYYDGSVWTEIYSATASTAASQSLTLANISANMQIRFTGNLWNRSGDSWSIDNVLVFGPESGQGYTWLTIDGATTGTVTSSTSNTINLTCDAAGLTEGTYTADITVDSNDPDTPTSVIPVTFDVAQTTVIPGVPANISTSISGTDLVIDWDVAADATSYDVYSSDDPYGSFTFEANVGTNQYVVPADTAKKFYYIVSKNSTK